MLDYLLNNCPSDLVRQFVNETFGFLIIHSVLIFITGIFYRI